jgi:hypothetical protein
VVGVGLLENIEANRILLTYLAIAFVFAYLVVRLRSFVRALLSMVPVLTAVGAASLVAWIFDLQLSPMTAVGGPLVVAVCTEFTSLILLRFIEERRRGYGPEEAMDVTARRTGRAFIVSALTAISGVAVTGLRTMISDTLTSPSEPWRVASARSNSWKVRMPTMRPCSSTTSEPTPANMTCVPAISVRIAPEYGSRRACASTMPR